jgi:hypothetical protein
MCMYAVIIVNLWIHTYFFHQSTSLNMLGSLDNEVIFKKAFSDKIVLTQFVKDILGLEVEFGNIETEKKFDPKVGHINFELDVFAESVDKRIVVELQRAQYDYNFDCFMHYLYMLIAAQQASASKVVYMIVFITFPYKWDNLTQYPTKEKRHDVIFVLKTLHFSKMICLNPS